MFTDRFCKIPIHIYNRKHADITGVEEYEDSWEKFLPLDLSSYYPSPQEDGTVFTQVTLKNGHHFLVVVHPNEFEKIVNTHFDAQR